MKSNRFNFFCSFLVLFVLIEVSFADTNGIWHYAQDVRSGTFGSDENGSNYNFLGFVGINTTNASALLQVGNKVTSGYLGDRNYNFAVYGGNGLVRNKDYWVSFDIENTLNNSGASLDLRSGNIPGMSIYVLGENSYVMDISNGVSGGIFGSGISFTHPSNGSEKGEINFLIRKNWTSSGTAVKIDSLGNMGIGTILPTERLEVNGSIKATKFCIENDCKANWSSLTTINETDPKVGVLNNNKLCRGTGSTVECDFSLPPVCTGNNVGLQWNGTSWSCINFSVGCVDTCSLSGQAICSNGNTLLTCGNYDLDSCLEYNQGTTCINGCNNGLCNPSSGSMTKYWKSFENWTGTSYPSERYLFLHLEGYYGGSTSSPVFTDFSTGTEFKITFNVTGLVDDIGCSRAYGQIIVYNLSDAVLLNINGIRPSSCNYEQSTFIFNGIPSRIYIRSSFAGIDSSTGQWHGHIAFDDILIEKIN